MKFLLIGLLIFIVFIVLKTASDALGENGRRDMRIAARPYLFRLAAAVLIVIVLIALAVGGASIRLL